MARSSKLNTNITRRQALLIAAGVVTVTVVGVAVGTGGSTDEGAKRYEIVYKLDGGKNPKDQPETIEQGATIEVKALKTPSKRGYAFAGWYDDDWLDEKATKIYGDKDEAGRTLFAT